MKQGCKQANKHIKTTQDTKHANKHKKHKKANNKKSKTNYKDCRKTWRYQRQGQTQQLLKKNKTPIKNKG